LKFLLFFNCLLSGSRGEYDNSREDEVKKVHHCNPSKIDLLNFLASYSSCTKTGCKNV